MSKAFSGRPVVERASFSVPAGQVALLEGANGAGKTTLLRILATLVRPDEGDAVVGGHSVIRSPSHVRSTMGVALVNERSLYWRLTGRENLRFFARSAGMSRPAAAARIDELTEELAAGDLVDRRVASLSAGQRQRLLVARAALRRPTVLLLDEPLRGLDDEGYATMLAFVAGQRSAGTTVLVAAPRTDDFGGLPDVRLRIHSGRVESDADPGHLPGTATR